MHELLNESGNNVDVEEVVLLSRRGLDMRPPPETRGGPLFRLHRAPAGAESELKKSPRPSADFRKITDCSYQWNISIAATTDCCKSHGHDIVKKA